MKFILNDGGRAAAGFKGATGDCVARAVAIASGKPYAEVYAALALGAGNERKSRGKSARNGIHTSRDWFKRYMAALGFVWTPTMKLGSGCKVHLTDGELPMGRLVVSVSKHVCAVIDGVINDTHNPERNVHTFDPERGHYISRRCVYGYWTLQPLTPLTQ